jgi:biotin transport system substrate-specific component
MNILKTAETHMFIKRNNTMTKELSLPDERASVQTFWAITFSILTAIGAQIEIPNQPVPYTLQTFFVLLAGALLGKRSGSASMGLYLILGAIGIPVFTGGAFGLSRILGPTGGYLLSFPIAAFVVGYLVKLRREFWWIMVSTVIGSFIIFTIGTIQLNIVYVHNWVNSIQAGFLIFSWWDGVKIIGVSTIAHHYFRKVNQP